MHTHHTSPYITHTHTHSHTRMSTHAHTTHKRLHKHTVTLTPFFNLVPGPSSAHSLELETHTPFLQFFQHRQITPASGPLHMLLSQLPLPSMPHWANSTPSLAFMLNTYFSRRLLWPPIQPPTLFPFIPLHPFFSQHVSHLASDSCVLV